MEDLELDVFNDHEYYDSILSSLHNYVKGGEFYPVEII